MDPTDETSGAAYAAYAAATPPPTPPTQRAHAQIRARRTRDRATSWHNAFIGLFLLGLIGAAFIAYAASSVTTVETGGFLATTTTTHDMGVAVPIFIGAAMAAFLTSLPLLGFSHVLQAQADVLDLV